jgi:N-acetylglutamate synthase-like GNAT family acetyltransferase
MKSGFGTSDEPHALYEVEMSPESPILRPLAEDEIETVRTVEKLARIRYRALGGFWTQAVESPAIAAERFARGKTIVAELDGKLSGFVLLQPLDELLYVASVAVSPDAAGLGIGRLLMIGAEHHAQQLKVGGLSLATFRLPPWNGPWFRRQGYLPIPEKRIGPGLRTVLDRHATFLDMATRETLWKPIDVRNGGE